MLFVRNLEDDSGYEVEPEEYRIDKDANGGNSDEFDLIYESVYDMHDEDTFE